MRLPLPLVRVGVLLLVLVPGLGTAGSLFASAGHTSRILLHVGAVTTKNQCTRPELNCCSQAVNYGVVGQFYNLYVLAAPSDSLWMAGGGVAGIQFGINYSGQYDPAGSASGLCVFSWSLCGALEFPTPNPAWPNAGSGNLMTWDAVQNCQLEQVAVAGYFYMCAYESGNFTLLPRPVDGVAKLASCDAVEHDVLGALSHTEALAFASFTPQGANYGGNPCEGPCLTTAVVPATWSRIKAQPR